METKELYNIYFKHPIIQTDTRQLLPGCIFFALSGVSFDGNAFAKAAIEKGAAYAIIDNPKFAESEQFIVVDNVLESLQKLANWHRRQLRIPFIAITGSNGKTTTKELIGAVLRRKYITYATEGNLNNHIGIPLTILRIKPDAQIAIIEMGANHLKEIEGYCKIALPTYGIITNCGKAHLEGFGSLDGVKQAKGELYDYLRTNRGTVFLNTDLDYLIEMAKGISNTISYGSTGAGCIGKPLMKEIFLQVELFSPRYIIMDTQLVGAYNFANALTAIAVGLHFGIPIEDIKAALAAYKPDNSRSQFMERSSNKIVLDAYNANPSSMQEAIMNFAAMNVPNKILWIGGMKEMGAEERKEHIRIVELINQYEWADVVLTGEEFRYICGQNKWFSNAADATKYIKNNVPKDSYILIKGSRGSRMELLLDAL